MLARKAARKRRADREVAVPIPVDESSNPREATKRPSLLSVFSSIPAVDEADVALESSIDVIDDFADGDNQEESSDKDASDAEVCFRFLKIIICDSSK